MYRVYWGEYLLHDLTIPEEEGYCLQVQEKDRIPQ